MTCNIGPEVLIQKTLTGSLFTSETGRVMGHTTVTIYYLTRVLSLRDLGRLVSLGVMLPVEAEAGLANHVVLSSKTTVFQFPR